MASNVAFCASLWTHSHFATVPKRLTMAYHEQYFRGIVAVKGNGRGTHQHVLDTLGGRDIRNTNSSNVKTEGIVVGLIGDGLIGGAEIAIPVVLSQWTQLTRKRSQCRTEDLPDGCAAMLCACAAIPRKCCPAGSRLCGLLHAAVPARTRTSWH